MKQEPDHLTAEIRPGVLRPDWSAVTTPAAREALGGRMTARAGLLDRWAQALDPDEDLLWRTLLRLYGAAGRPPELDDIARETGMVRDRISSALGQLQSRDLIGLKSGSGAIRHAYPFTENATGHRVELGGHVLTALCAVDALGVGDMYRADIRVRGKCRSCGCTIEVATSNQGRALAEVAPAQAVVWYDFAYGESAASSCCRAIAFFCSDEHLQRWLNGERPARAGVRLKMNEALELGRAIFGPVLRERMPVGA